MAEAGRKNTPKLCKKKPTVVSAAAQMDDAASTAFAGEAERPSHWMVAIVPFFGDVRIGKTLQPCWEEASIIGNDADAEGQKQFYELIRELKWFPPRARDVILQALGSTRSKQKFDDGTRRLMRLQHRIDQGATYKQIAADEGITVVALRQQLKRFKREQRSSRTVRIPPRV
jgi:hypothetical protein